MTFTQEQLRDWADWAKRDRNPERRELAAEALRGRLRIAALEAELAAAQNAAGSYMSEASRLEAERDALKAENEKLQWRLDTVVAVMCDKLICGHFLPEEIRQAIDGRLDYLRELEKDGGK